MVQAATQEAEADAEYRLTSTPYASPLPLLESSTCGVHSGSRFQHPPQTNATQAILRRHQAHDHRIFVLPTWTHRVQHSSSPWWDKTGHGWDGAAISESTTTSKLWLLAFVLRSRAEMSIGGGHLVSVLGKERFSMVKSGFRFSSGDFGHLRTLSNWKHWMPLLFIKTSQLFLGQDSCIHQIFAVNPVRTHNRDPAFCDQSVRPHQSPRNTEQCRRPRRCRSPNESLSYTTCHPTSASRKFVAPELM